MSKLKMMIFISFYFFVCLLLFIFMIILYNNCCKGVDYMNIKYFDNAATTRVDDDVIEYMIPYMKEVYFNPSSLYKPSIMAKKAVNDAKATKRAEWSR